MWKSQWERGLTPPPSLKGFAEPCFQPACSTPLCLGPVSLVHSSSCPGRDCRLSEHTGSERFLPCLRPHSTAPSDSKLLSHSLRSSGPTGLRSPGVWRVDLCPLSKNVPSAFSHRPGPPGTRVFSWGFRGRVAKACESHF